ncbi:hypothetical protein EOPP23_17255 [Endozoicomonas sp. OPT23]|uniref:hypothetical protein n=1 Tax=Endozoicomonas sp. OPT23 TaxID=2072845 RepID=UPI00129BE8CC|nr:hypothetical protein [Endozoicomonas sp. OPT23]MRI34733.1 hypothetical protein [Endozoicomonas sp. OPT23]
MKQIKVAVRKKGEPDSSTDMQAHDSELRKTLERLLKKGLNPMQVCQKLIEHNEAAPEGKDWSYDLVVSECQRLKIDHH